MLTKLISKPSIVTISTGRDETLIQGLTKGKVINLPLIEMEQVHGVEIAIITEPETQTVKGVDALITTLPNVVLAARTADCLPVLITHPSGVIGIAHCGRKSTEDGLLRKVLEKLKTEFGAHDNVTLWFGPAICERCYQIDQEKDLHYNLVRKNFQQVGEVYPDGSASVLPSNKCTAHDNVNYYSYRKEGVVTERNYSLIARVED